MVHELAWDGTHVCEIEIELEMEMEMEDSRGKRKGPKYQGIHATQISDVLFSAIYLLMQFCTHYLLHRGSGLGIKEKQ